LYVRIKNLSGNGDFQPLQSVLSELSQKDGIILDLRDNGGGNDGIARGFVNKITEIERTYELVRFRNGPGRNDFGDWIEAKITPDDPITFEKPIIVLINRGVVSSAESFVAMIKTLPNAILLGDTTRGSTGNPKEFILSNGWKYHISSWQSVTPDFEFIEDQGIAPDVVINNTEESVEEGRDLILEKAIELLE
jgi:carboxyl-terminal processing protease